MAGASFMGNGAGPQSSKSDCRGGCLETHLGPRIVPDHRRGHAPRPSSSMAQQASPKVMGPQGTWDRQNILQLLRQLKTKQWEGSRVSGPLYHEIFRGHLKNSFLHKKNKKPPKASTRRKKRIPLKKCSHTNGPENRKVPRGKKIEDIHLKGQKDEGIKWRKLI